MRNFKVICAKNNQKIELIVKYNSIEEARENLHKQGYSIIDIKEISEEIDNSGVFYFEAIINGEKKSGQIKSNDAFKAYIKLVDDLHYNVIYIYDEKNIDEKQKILTTQKIKQTYENFKNNEKKKEKDIKKETKSKKDIQVSDFILKELNYYYNIIDKISEKAENILSKHGNNIDPVRKEKINQTFTALKQAKNITNITKLKSIGELALIKIGELEKELVLNNSELLKENILKDTNKLLKNLGSKNSVSIPKIDQFKIIKENISSFIKEKFLEKKDENIEKIDKNSYSYQKIRRELDTYKQKLKEVNKELLKANITFNKDKISRNSIKKRLILQNINIAKNRLENKKFSYTKIVKGFEYYHNFIKDIIQKLGDFIIYITLFYSLFFIFINLFSIKINYEFLRIIVLLSLFGIILKLSKNLYILGISIIFYITLFLYIIINF